MHVKARGQPWVSFLRMTGCFSPWSLRKGLHLTWNLLIRLGWPDSPRICMFVPPQCWDCKYSWLFSVESGGLNPDLYAYKASTLPTEPSPRSPALTDFQYLLCLILSCAVWGFAYFIVFLSHFLTVSLLYIVNAVFWLFLGLLCCKEFCPILRFKSETTSFPQNIFVMFY